MASTFESNRQNEPTAPTLNGWGWSDRHFSCESMKLHTVQGVLALYNRARGRGPGGWSHSQRRVSDVFEEPARPHGDGPPRRSRTDARGHSLSLGDPQHR